MPTPGSPRVVTRGVHDDMRRMEAIVEPGDATVVRPSGLFDPDVDPDAVTDYLVEPGSADGVFTSRADLAAATLAELVEAPVLPCGDGGGHHGRAARRRRPRAAGAAGAPVNPRPAGRFRCRAIGGSMRVVTRMVRFTELGGPEVLTIVDEQLPDPRPGEALVDVAAIGLNRAESMFRTGTYIEPTRLPAGLGYEASATVAAVGEGVTRWAPGDPVSVVPAFSMNDHTVYGEQAIVPARALVPRPVDAVTGAAVWMPFLVAYAGLLEPGVLRPADTVLVTAASSSVGLAAIAVANRIGAVPIATSRTREKAQRLLDAGAAHVIVTGEEDLAAAALELTEGRGLDVVYDAIAGPAVEQMATAVAPGGTIVIHGRLSGEPTIFPTATLPDLIVRSFTLFAMTRDEARLQRAAAFVSAGLRGGDFIPVVDRIFDGLDSIVEAHEHLDSGTQVGKIVVTV